MVRCIAQSTDIRIVRYATRVAEDTEASNNATARGLRESIVTQGHNIYKTGKYNAYNNYDTYEKAQSSYPLQQSSLPQEPGVPHQ